MSSIRCRVGFHDWSKYSEMVKAYDGLTQFRICNRCNRISYATCYGNQASSEDANRTVELISDAVVSSDAVKQPQRKRNFELATKIEGAALGARGNK